LRWVEAIEGDGNFTVILYQDRELTEYDSVYGEASKDGIRYSPVELKVIPIMAAPENKSYNSSNGGLRHLQDGQLTFGIYDAQLTELNVELLW
jgi:hypothetical protein